MTKKFGKSMKTSLKTKVAKGQKKAKNIKKQQY